MVRIWLFGYVAWVFSMLVLGSVTRLTRSSLSITDWKFTGTLPPLSDWLIELRNINNPGVQTVSTSLTICLHCQYKKLLMLSTSFY